MKQQRNCHRTVFVQTALFALAAGIMLTMSACGVSEDDGESDTEIDSGMDAATDSEIDAPNDTSSDAPVLDCEQALSDLSQTVARGPETDCMGTLRLDYETLQPLGYAVSCADQAPTFVSVDEALQTAVDELTFNGPANLSNATMISDPSDVNPGYDFPYIFYQAPSDFGAVAAVNPRNGDVLFGASIVWSGTGGIVYPGEWNDEQELASGCGQGSLDDLPVDSFDLTPGGGVLSDDALDAVMEATEQTVLADALLAGTAAYLKNVVVLAYPRTVGAFDPSSAEYVVFVHAGWE